MTEIWTPTGSNVLPLGIKQDKLRLEDENEPLHKFAAAGFALTTVLPEGLCYPIEQYSPPPGQYHDQLRLHLAFGKKPSAARGAPAAGIVMAPYPRDNSVSGIARFAGRRAT